MIKFTVQGMCHTWERGETGAADSGAPRHSQEFIESADGHGTEFPPAHPLLPTDTTPAPPHFPFPPSQGNNSHCGWNPCRSQPSSACDLSSHSAVYICVFGNPPGELRGGLIPAVNTSSPSEQLCTPKPCKRGRPGRGGGNHTAEGGK